MPKTDPLTGSQLGSRYRIISRIGEGGMGVTYRAWDSHAGRPVVLKCPKPEMLGVSGFIDRFDREARMLAELQHANIVPISDLGSHEGLPYFVMPYLPGGSLANRRLRDAEGRAKPMQPSTLHLWLPQVAAALDHVHAAGLIHRDVKPANIFFNSSWRAYLGDFGIAKSIADTGSPAAHEPLTALNVAIGTPEYMAPEMFSWDAKIDGRIDQYALAVVVYELLAGKRPFASEGNVARIAADVKNTPPPLLGDTRRDLPASLQQAVYAALSKNPADRFPDCLAFSRAALADVPPATDEPGVARLLCPTAECNNNLKLPASAAGKKGRCPRCSNQMIIAPDLSALWLVREESGGLAMNPRQRRASRRQRDESQPRGWLADIWDQLPDPLRWTLFTAGLAVLVFCGSVVVAQIGTARERLEHKQTAATLQLAQQRIMALEQAVKNLEDEKSRLERENNDLRNEEP